VYTLYYSPGTASLVVHWMLIEIGAPFALKLVDFEVNGQKHPDYLKLNPNGTVPTLIVDGAPRYESAALALMLAERHPNAGFAPSVDDRDARAAYLQWTVHLANALMPAFRRWFYADEIAGPDAAEAVKAHARLAIEAAFDRIDARLAETGAYLAGDQLTAVDFLATMLARWSRNMPKPANQWPNVARFLATMTARPTWKAVHDREGIEVWPAA
jgi:glutathione S-transferase